MQATEQAGECQMKASDFDWLVGYLYEEELTPPIPVSPKAPLPKAADSEPRYPFYKPVFHTM